MRFNSAIPILNQLLYLKTLVLAYQQDSVSLSRAPRCKFYLVCHDIDL